MRREHDEVGKGVGDPGELEHAGDARAGRQQDQIPGRAHFAGNLDEPSDAALVDEGEIGEIENDVASTAGMAQDDAQLPDGGCIELPEQPKETATTRANDPQQKHFLHPLGPCTPGDGEDSSRGVMAVKSLAARGGWLLNPSLAP